MSKTILFGNAAAYTTAANPSLLTSGQIGVYSIGPDGTLTLISNAAGVTATVKSRPLMIAQGGVIGGNFKFVTLNPGSIISAPAAATSYVAPVPNVNIVGYAGSGSDTIQASVAGTYNLTVTNTTQGTVPMPFNLASVYYQTAAQATPIQVAYDWARLINQKTLNASLYSFDRFVFAHVLTNQASSAIGGSETLTVTNGSTSVTSSGTSHGLVAGDWVRIGHASTLTLPVYKVAAVNGASITLATPYVNSSLAIGASISSVAAGELTAVPDASDLAGVRLVSFGDWFPGTAFVEKKPNTSIAAGVSGAALGTVVVHNGVSAQSYLNAAGAITSGVFNMGYGTGWQAQKQEFEAQGFQGNMNRSWLPYPVQLFASATSNYDSYVFTYKSTPEDAANAGYARQEIHSCQLFCITPATDSGDTLAAAVLPAIIVAYGA